MAQRMQGGYPPYQQDQYGAPGGSYGNQDPYGQQQQQYGGQEQQSGSQEQQHGGQIGGQQQGEHQQPGHGEEGGFGNPQEQQQHEESLGGAQHPGYPGGNPDGKALTKNSAFVHPHDELADDKHHNMMMDAMHEMSHRPISKAQLYSFLLVVIWFLSFVMKHLGVTDPETRHPSRFNAKHGGQQQQQQQQHHQEQEGGKQERDQGEQEPQY